MDLTDFLSKKGKAKNEKPTGWLRFCTLEVTTGSLWAGDPWIANADDGCVVKVPRGRYVIEGIGHASGRDRVVSRVRVRLESVENPKLGKPLGETGTDSAMIGVCDIRAFDQALGPDPGEEYQEAIEAQTKKGFGIFTLPQFPGAVMPFVPIGSDGSGPVHALMDGRKRVGIELPLTSEIVDDDEDTDHAIVRRTAGGREATFWLEIPPTDRARFCVWSNTPDGPVDYRIRSAEAVVKDWAPIKGSNKDGGLFRATGRLPAGRYEFDFRIGERVFSALKFTVS